MTKLTGHFFVSWIVLASILSVAFAGPLIIGTQTLFGGRASKLSDAEWLWAAQIFTAAGLFAAFGGHSIFIPILASSSLLCLMLCVHIMKYGGVWRVKSEAQNTWTSTCGKICTVLINSVLLIVCILVSLARY
jgi:hypothetical protein